MSLCLICKASNPERNSYCGSCGALLDNTTLPNEVLTPPIPPPAVSKEIQTLLGLTEDPTFFSSRSMVILLASSHPDPLEFIVPEDSGRVLGRRYTHSTEHRLLDLNAFSAFNLGVSRHHAELVLRGHSLRIMDLDSTNGTFVNGARLLPRELRGLVNGDTLQLGSLTMRVFFRHPA